MNLNRSVSIAAIAILSGLFAESAMAQAAENNLVTFGVSYLSFNSSVGGLNSTGSNPAEAGAFNAINNSLGTTAAWAENTEQVTFSLLHMFTDHVAGEVVLGVPPTVHVALQIPGAGVAYQNTVPTQYPEGASSKPWTPTLFLKYLFNDPKDKFRPYLGIGASFATFKNVTVQNVTLLETLGGGGAQLSSSWNAVGTAGVIFNINDRWSVMASASYMPLKTTATFISGSGATTTSGVLKLDPTICNISAGYNF